VVSAIYNDPTSVEMYIHWSISRS